MFLICFLFADAARATELNVAYPAEGTIINAQVGLVLEKTDILKKHGFSGRVRAMGTGRELKTALVSGHADVIFSSQTNFVVLIGSGFEGYAVSTLGEAGRLALVVKPTSPVKTLADLKGRRVGTIFGTSIHQPLLEWLKAEKLERDVKVVDVASHAALQASLETGAIDAVMTWDPYLARGLNQNSYRIVKEQTFGLITIASAKVAQNADVLARFNAATREAMLYAAQHKKEVNGWFGKMAKLDDASRLNKNYEARQLAEVDLSLSPTYRARLSDEAKFLYEIKTVPRLADVPRHIIEVR
jgi:ABC-type nitrate/sulfonate/bicarbonate transport system substrate-binding protein